MQKNKRVSKVKNLILDHVQKNLKEYLIMILLFLIGLIAGVIFINHATDSQKQELEGYYSSVITQLKENASINQLGLLKESVGKNLALCLFLWFIGLTVIGIPILYGTIVFRGFCLGYTISSIIMTLGTGKGILFTACTILLQNILLIPCILALGVSGIKLYKAISKQDKKTSVKAEITRHTFFSIFILILFIIASLIEVYISSNLLTWSIAYL